MKCNDIYDMLAKMTHRGPDHHGIYADGKIKRAKELEGLKDAALTPSRIALGHSRLTIIGQGAETQPYESCDGKLVLIHNGEIYNYQKLRTLLQGEHNLKTTSDSEVIVHLLEETYRGDLLNAVKRIIGLLDGMYTLAVTDGRSVVVARDPVGKKPLYFLEREDVTFFASEKKALWNDTDKPRRLMPGELLHLSGNEVSVHQGFPLQLPQIDITDFREAVDLYKDVLTKAIEKRLSGLDSMPLGVIFSGGIDSVLVAKLLQQQGRNIFCYCTGTENSGDIIAAKEVAEDLGLPLKTKIIDEELVEKLLPTIIREVEEGGLLQVEVAIPMYLATQMGSEDGIRVMFTGQAADEIWAGYPWYTDVIEEDGYLRLHEKLWEDLNYLYTDTLEREDKLTMAHSVELRAPYLDRDVVQLSMRVSPKLKIQGINDDFRKRVHRQAAVELGVPPYLSYRIKDPAQTGSGIHGIIQEIAINRIGETDANLVKQNIARDKGSLYRYGDEEYGKDLTRTMLQQIEDKVRKEFTVPFLNV